MTGPFRNDGASCYTFTRTYRLNSNDGAAKETGCAFKEHGCGHVLACPDDRAFGSEGLRVHDTCPLPCHRGRSTAHTLIRRYSLMQEPRKDFPQQPVHIQFHAWLKGAFVGRETEVRPSSFESLSLCELVRAESVDGCSEEHVKSRSAIPNSLLFWHVPPLNGHASFPGSALLCNSFHPDTIQHETISPSHVQHRYINISKSDAPI